MYHRNISRILIATYDNFKFQQGFRGLLGSSDWDKLWSLIAIRENLFNNVINIFYNDWYFKSDFNDILF